MAKKKAAKTNARKVTKAAKAAPVAVTAETLPYRKGISIPREILAKLADLRSLAIAHGANEYTMNRPGWEALIVGEVVTKAHAAAVLS